MDNDGTHFFRSYASAEDRLSRDSQREYPREVFPFGMEGVELFAHQFEDIWHVTEKSTGLLVGRGNELFAARADAQKVISQIGREEFIEAIKDTLSKLNTGMEYDCQKKLWIDPGAPKPIIAPEISGAPDA